MDVRSRVGIHQRAPRCRCRCPVLYRPHGHVAEWGAKTLWPLESSQGAAGSSRLPVTANFFDRYFESYISYPFPPCATGVPELVRTGGLNQNG